MKKLLLFYCCFLSFTGILAAQTITYSKDIVPIIYKHCTTCHRPGEVAPFSLTNYDEVVSWSSMIAYVTEIGYMPPWKAEVGYQQYQQENYLTTDQVQLIADWVAQGTVQGNPADEPPLPVFPVGSQVGLPDLVVSFAQSYTHAGDGMDEYRYFVIPTGLTEDKDLVALEVRPGNKQIVHHCLVWQDTSGTAAADDAAAPGYGYPGGQFSTLNGLNDQLPGYVPGQKPIVFTQGIAQRLYANSDLKLQMHYAPTASDEQDSSSVNLFFAQKPATRFLKSKVMIPFAGTLTNGPFIIPANQVKKFHGTWTIPEDASMVGVQPHCHKLGQAWEVFAITPNQDTINMVRVNDWDFNWQGMFYFKKLIPLPKNSVIHAYATYDNTANNVENPNSPPKFVIWGENTDDEMYYLPLLYLSYQPGDEDLVLDDVSGVGDNPQFYTIHDALYPVLSPNPASDQVKVGFTLASGSTIALRLFNQQGQMVRSWETGQFYLPGLHTRALDLSLIPAGIYTLVLETKDKRHAQQLVVASAR
jgi:hypothetical protein